MDVDSVIICIMAVFLVLLLGYVVYANRMTRKSSLLLKEHEAKAAESKRQKLEVVNFFSGFSNSFRDYENPTSTMNSMATYIADLVGAETVCIYETKYNFLFAMGVHGNYSLCGRSLSLAGATTQESRLAVLRREKINMGVGFIGELAAARREELVVSALQDDRFSIYADYEKLGSVIAVPMVQDQRLHGVVIATGAKNGGVFTEESLESLAFVASQVIMVKTLLGSYVDRSRQQRINQELDFTRNLQSSMLPQSLPEMELFEIHAYTGSAKEVNGDFYDFVEIDENRLLVIIGDACGKGVPACMLTSMTRSFIRSAVDHFNNMEDFLCEVNRNLERVTDPDRYVTLGCCLLHLRSGIVEYGRAGHTELLVHLQNHLRTYYPKGNGAGMLPEEFAYFETISLELRSGATMMMFSDGLNEAVNNDNEEFGVERLKSVFTESCQSNDSLEVTVNKILEGVRRFAIDQSDDQTLIVIRRR